MADNTLMQTVGQASNPNFDPAEYARQQQAIQLGQALLQQGMQAPEGQMVSGHYVAPAATQQLARLLNAYAGNKMMTGGNEYMTRTNIANTNAMLGGLPSGQGQAPSQPQAMQAAGGQSQGVPFSQAGYPAVSAAPQGAPSSAAGYSPSGQAGSNPFTRENVIQGMILNGFSPDAAKAFWARTAPAPTPELINMEAQGIDPHSVAGLTIGKMQKEAYIAPVEKNGLYRDPITLAPRAFTPEVAPGSMPVFDATGNVAGYRTAEGQPVTYNSQLQANANSTAAGSGNVDMVQVFNPDTQQMELVPKTIAAQAAGGGAPAGNNFGNIRPPGASTGFQSYQTPEAGLSAIDKNLQAYGARGINTLSGVISRWAPPSENDTQAYIKDVSQRLGIDPNQPIDLNNPAIRQAIGTGIMLHEHGPKGIFGSQPKPMAAGPRLGDTAGATAQATDSQASWAKLQEATRQAQTTTSYLQNINDLAQKAIVGPAASKLNLANGLLSLVPGTQGAKDAQAAADLLNKYSSQIVARLGAGGMGTDSARTILQAAYPGTHMSAPAIHEAVANLVGANEMVKAKATLLAPYGNSRNYVEYQKAEMAFDKNADPRIWQYKALRESNPQAAQKFLKETLKQDPHFIDKADALSKLGVF